MVTGLLGRRCETWRRQLLMRGDVEISASSYYRLFNGEAIVNPWYSQIDVYISAHLVTVAVALSSEGPAICSILGALAPAAIL